MPESNSSRRSLEHSSAKRLRTTLRELHRSQGPAAVRRAIKSLPPEHARALLYDWVGFWAREEQLEPEDDGWIFWLIRAGRGWGKTRTGAETVNLWAEAKVTEQILIAGRTAGDVRQLQIEGPSGILRRARPWFEPKYFPSKREVRWPNGVIGVIRYGDEPAGFRGFEGGRGWLDELFHWAYAEEAYDNLVLSMREAGTVGNTRMVITSTPRPTALMRRVLRDPDTRDVKGHTMDNRANVDPKWLRKMIAMFGNSRKGLQELAGEVLTDAPGAAWSFEVIARNRVDKIPAINLVVIGVDPAFTEDGHNAETGIVVVGIGDNGHAYVLEDASGIYSAEGWASAVVFLHRKWDAAYVVAEVNNGGNLVARNIHVEDPSVVVVDVNAKQGKRLRSEAFVALYGRGMIHHMVGATPQEPGTDPNRFAALEYEMAQVDPDEMRRKKSAGDDELEPGVPRDLYDRVDALVYALSYGMFGKPPEDVDDWLDGYAVKDTPQGVAAAPGYYQHPSMGRRGSLWVPLRFASDPMPPPAFDPMPWSVEAIVDRCLSGWAM